MRGPSYTDEEKKVLAKVAAKKGLTLKQRVEMFFAELPDCDRSPDAVMQRVRKMVLEREGGKAPTPPKAAAAAEKPAAKKRGRPAARAKTNGNGNGHAAVPETPVVNSRALDDTTVTVGKVTIKGPFQDVAKLLQIAS